MAFQNKRGFFNLLLISDSVSFFMFLGAQLNLVIVVGKMALSYLGHVLCNLVK